MAPTRGLVAPGGAATIFGYGRTANKTAARPLQSDSENGRVERSGGLLQVRPDTRNSLRTARSRRRAAQLPGRQHRQRAPGLHDSPPPHIKRFRMFGKATLSRVLRPALTTLLLALPAAALAQERPLPSVTVETVIPQDFTLKTRLPGRIKASTVAEVRPQVSGILRERLFEEGSRVEADQPLYKIEDENYAAAVASAKAAVAQAQASYDHAIIEADRAAGLFARGSGSAAQRDNTQATRNRTEAALQMAKAQLTSAEIDFERTTINAPISGVIGFSQTTPGALVAAQQANPLTTIRTLDPIYVDVTQSATDLMRWNSDGASSARDEGLTASMILPDGTTYAHKGELKAAEPQVAPTTGMVTLRISFPNPDQLLLPGLYVEVELPQTETKDAILIPQSAVMRNAKGEAFTWIVEDGKVAIRPVTILTNSGNDWVTTSGLKAGDKVITSGFQKAAPGAAVQVVENAADKQAAAGGSN